MSEIARITIDEVQDRLDRGERLVFVDARNPAAWGSSPTKLPGAVRVPADDVARHLDDVPRNTPIVTYCT
jgi:rhodanese-related sulfurtransferase